MDVAKVANELLPRLYTAACGEGEWTDFLMPLAEITGARFAHVLSVTYAIPDPKQGPIGVQRQWIRQVGIGDELLRALAAPGQMDPWMASLTSGRFQEGWVGRGPEMVSDDALRKTEYYRIIHDSYDIKKAVGLLLLKRPGHLAIGGLLRGEREGEFDDDTIALMRQLAPHMSAAVRVYDRMGELEETVESLEVALEQFAIGVVVLDRAGQVIFRNHLAQQLLASRDGLVLHQGHLRATAAPETRQLHEQIESAIRDAEAAQAGAKSRPSVSVTAVRRQHGPPLHAFTTAWCSTRQVALRRPAAVVLITEPERGAARDLAAYAL